MPGENQTELRLIDIATREVVTGSADTPLSAAASTMAQHRYSSLVVVDDAGHPQGIVTERNILHAMRDAMSDDTPLRVVMSSPLITLPADTPALDGYRICLREGIRHLVLVDDAGALCGLVSDTDFRQHMELTVLAGRRRIVSITQRTAVALPPEARLSAALDLMHAQRKTCVAVVEGDRPIGIVTERDVVRLYSGRTGWEAVSLREVMTTPVLCIPVEASTSQAAELMLAHGVRHLVVTDSAGHMRGLVEEQDLTRLMSSGLREQRAGLEESFLRTLLDTIPDLVWLKDVDGRYLACNPRFGRLYGKRERDLVGKTDYEFVERDLADFFRQNDREAMAAGTPCMNEEWLTFADDGYHGLFETLKTPMRDANGRLIGVLGIARDITARKQQQQRLELLQRAVDASGDAVFLIARDLRFHYVNETACRLLGYTREQLLQMTPADIDPDMPLSQMQEMMEQAREGESKRFETRHRTREGSTFDVEISATIINYDGARYSLAMVRDVTDRRRVEEALRINASVFDNSQEAIVVTDAGNRIIDVNNAFTHITGYTRGEVLGKDPRLLSSGRQDAAFYAAMWQTLREHHTWRGEIWNRRKDGEVFAEMLSISLIADEHGRVQRHVGVFSDITYLKDHEAELSHVANYDALTGVPNRRLLADRMHQAMGIARRGDALLAVCYLDLDGFKEVNDRHGHEQGDKLLVEIARRLLSMLRAGDTLARLGGDEFVLLFNDLRQESECYNVLDRLMAVIAEPVALGTAQVTVSASVGVTFFPDDDADGDTLLRHADQAMYVAKQRGKNRFHVYDARHDQRVRSLHEGRRRIERGLLAGEFELYYQPKQDLTQGTIFGVEALIRWNHPERGLLAPYEFLPIIENSELDVQLGEWVIEHALAQMAAWQRAGIALQVSVNISAHHLQTAGFVGALQRRLERHPQLPRGALQIEVLETAALDDIVQSSEVIAQCRALGVSFALDDFGTGYSSLVYLSRLGADTLKIDQSFIQGMSLNQGDQAIVQGVIALARAFGRETVAEGVEDAMLASRLAAMGCDYAQGYSIAQPMPAGEFLTWLQSRKQG